jgi:guanylate kinase
MNAPAQHSAKKEGKFVLLIGPSGVGKSVILRHLRSKHKSWHFPKSATTRARRPNEGNLLYEFVTDEEFDELLRQDKLLEWAIVHGGARYGTLVDEIIPPMQKGKTVVREVDVQGFDGIRRNVLFNTEEKKSPYKMTSIFIFPESIEQLIQHITHRSPTSEEELKRRIESAHKELEYAKLCDHVVKNPEGKLEETIRKVEDIIMKS